MRKNTHVAKRTEGEQPLYVQHLLTMEDINLILDLRKVKVYDLSKRDGLPSLIINGARRIKPDKLPVWIEQHGEWLYSSVFTISAQIDA